MKKISITVGEDAKGNLSALFVGESASAALAKYEQPGKGIHYVAFFRFPLPFKKRRTGELVAIESARQEAHERAAREAYDKAQAEEKAKAAKKTLATAAEVKKAQKAAHAAEAEAKAAQAAQLAKVHEDLAAEARDKVKAAKQEGKAE